MTHTDPAGPVFISYRWSDGADIAIDAARRLRASGVPVWLDRDDLPPGETSDRLRDALSAGLSGAVMVATPNVGVKKNPDAILDIEAPTIFDQLEPDPAFTLAIINTAADGQGSVDRGAPARWYGRTDGKVYTQYSEIDGSLARLGTAMAGDRLRKLRARRTGSLLTIDLQTRLAGGAWLPAPADLVFRTIPPVTNRLPPPIVFEDLQAFASWLPSAVAGEQVVEIRLVGGAHLSVACAVGATVPETSGIRLAVRSSSGEDWRLHPGRFSAVERLPMIGAAPKLKRLRWTGRGPASAVLVDLVPTTALPTFESHLAASPEKYADAHVIASSTPLSADSASKTARHVVDLLHGLAARGATDLHLFLRTPWGVAALIGALLNTLGVTLYEWDDTGPAPAYLPTVTISPGAAGGPVTSIYAP